MAQRARPHTNPLRYYHRHVGYRHAHAKEIINFKNKKFKKKNPFLFFFFLMFIPPLFNGVDYFYF
jgi:hypothetical protein